MFNCKTLALNWNWLKHNGISATLGNITLITESIDKRRKLVHPLPARLFHWLNAAALFVMVTSGWQIYNASPLFAFKFPKMITLGNWLAGALQLHFAMMWVLLANLAVYLIYGVFAGHFSRVLFPLSVTSIFRDLNAAMRGRLSHNLGSYNAIQKVAYVGILVVIIMVIASGFAIWKPVQLQTLTALMGGYDRARYVHFYGMALICVFTVLHVAVAALLPKTLVAMVTGKANVEATGQAAKMEDLA